MEQDFSESRIEVIRGLSCPVRVTTTATRPSRSSSRPTISRASERRESTDMEQEFSESRIDVILDIDLPVVVRFGHTELPLRTLTRLGPGSVIDLGRSPDDPVEVMVSDRVIARGEVVIVGGNYGIRILDVVSATERMRTMEV